MKTGKRILAIILVIFILAGSSSCAGSPASPEQEPEDEQGSDTLVIAYYGFASGYIHEIADYLYETDGIKTELIHYKDEPYALDTKLMAKDSEIDIFLTITLDIHKYVTSGYYEDLSAYDSLKERIESSNYTKNVAAYNGGYFGMPCETRYMDNTIFMYMSPLFINYIKDNVDLLNGEFKDSSGEKLFEVFTEMYKKDGDAVELPLAEVDYKYTCDDYLIISPFSKNKDKAVRFLEEAFDFMSGTSELSNEWQFYSYPDPDENVDGMYITWKSHVPSIIKPILDARMELMNTDGSEGSIKKLAKEAAKEAAMRINE